MPYSSAKSATNGRIKDVRAARVDWLGAPPMEISNEPHSTARKRAIRQAVRRPRTIPDFGPGDTVIVNVKVVEGDRTRVQAYEGVCIGRSGGGLNESFTVRKISYGEGVERVFPVMSPMIELDQGRAPRQGPPRQALLPAQPARQVGPHRREDRITAPPSASKRSASRAMKSAGSPRAFLLRDVGDRRLPARCDDCGRNQDPDAGRGGPIGHPGVNLGVVGEDLEPDKGNQQRR